MTHKYSIRASSWGELFACPARWEAKHLLGMRLPPSAPAALGTAIHAATAAYDSALVLHKPIAVSDAVGVLVDGIQRPEEPVRWDDMSQREAESIGARLITRYCTEVAPRDAVCSVELPLTPMDIEVGGVTITLTGTMDRARTVITERGQRVRDLKTGKRAVDSRTGAAVTAGHAPQLGVYQLLLGHTTGAPVDPDAEILGMATVRQARIGIGSVANPRGLLVGAEGQPGLIEYAAQILKSGSFYGNPRDPLCSPKYCPRHRENGGGCRFHD